MRRLMNAAAGIGAAARLVLMALDELREQRKRERQHRELMEMLRGCTPAKVYGPFDLATDEKFVVAREVPAGVAGVALDSGEEGDVIRIQMTFGGNGGGDA